MRAVKSENSSLPVTVRVSKTRLLKIRDTTSIHSYNTRSSSENKFYIKKSRLEIQKRAFSRVGAKIWNEMPASLRELPKGRFTRYDFVAYDKLTTGLRHDLGPFSEL